jgi:anti-anti-sigma factor
MRTESPIERKLKRAAADPQARIVVDVRESTLFDAAILSLLVRLGKQLRAAGGDLVVVCRDATLRRLLGITLLDAAFGVQPTRAAAFVAVHGVGSPRRPASRRVRR